MAAFMVASWYCYARRRDGARWAWGAAACALLAFFTKAAAAFFVAAVGVDALVSLVLAWRRDPAERRSALWTLVALTVCGAVALAVFVVPNWDAYWFYNVQMSITRKPSYDIASVLNRVTWFPILHDLFTRMWLTLLLGLAAAATVVVRIRTASPGERLLVLWIALGALELLVHDVGNERRFIFFIPALVGLAGDPARPRPRAAARLDRRHHADTGAARAPVRPLRALRPGRGRGQARALVRGGAERAARGGPRGARHARDLRDLAAGPARAGGGVAGAGARWCSAACWSRVSSRSTSSGRPAARYENYAASCPAGRGAAARHARPRQAGERPRARERDPAGLRRARIRQLRRPDDAGTMCDIF